MPPGSRRDDKWFGGTAGAAKRAWDSMTKSYGKDAQHVYYARIAKLKRRPKR